MPANLSGLLSLIIPATALPSAVWRLAGLGGAFGASNPVTIGLRGEWGDVLIVSFGSLLWLGVLGLMSDRATQGTHLKIFERVALLPMLGLTAGLLIAADAYVAFTYVFGVSVNFDPMGRTLDPNDPAVVLAKACYAPLVLTGPLLLARARELLGRVDGPATAPGL